MISSSSSFFFILSRFAITSLQQADPEVVADGSTDRLGGWCGQSKRTTPQTTTIWGPYSICMRTKRRPLLDSICAHDKKPDGKITDTTVFVRSLLLLFLPLKPQSRQPVSNDARVIPIHFDRPSRALPNGYIR
jgi:hypothetical protein